MATSQQQQKLALSGGLKAVTRIEGKGQPKIGVEEFLSIAERFGLSTATRKKIRKLLTVEEIGDGPYLANYYSSLKETKVKAYERTARELFGSKFAIGVSSGTAALHAAFTAVGVGPGTEIIVPAIGFFATAAAIVTARGIPVFCDVDDSLSIDPRKISALVNQRTVAVAPTCVSGSVPNMAAIMKVARKHKIAVVEDCAQSCGGEFRGRPVGTFGDVGCFSISAYKIVGGGEGGLVLTDDQRLWDRAQGVIECGGLWRPDRFAAPRYDGELFCGTNYRMSELEAAVDVVQLRKMRSTAARFRNVKRRILKRLSSFREITPQLLNDADGEVGYNLRFYPETIDLGAKLVAAMKAEGIPVGMRGRSTRPDWHIYHSMFPVTLKGSATAFRCPWECPVYKKAGGKIEYRRGDCPVADDLFDRMVTVQLNQWYSPADCRHIADGMNKVFAAYCTAGAMDRPWIE